ncbi:transmembrane emp24 domain-containing protein 5 [Lingula anatina]|uniref:Transmembrane emp24 domain-containing protein 5 n=1 Tax=Lingula anatina TaxID=7574 RepID=A0A1S3KED8_LINAN|nr:transmembrane emp24 domain-containing protein 5 [Lingula anatina]|eukprot:XP_013420995.1 transmembrane emp24 domain-containing protein 5 [Lingula anatina]
MAAYTSKLVLAVIFITAVLYTTRTENVLGDSNEDFDFDGLPGSQHEFKIEIPAGRFECFYQKMEMDEEIHISFEVLRGAERQIDMVVKSPHGDLIENFQWKTDGAFERQIKLPGVYEFCFDNSFSRFASKLVYFYLVTFSTSAWDNFSKELQDMDIKTENFSQSIGKVDKAITDMLFYQGQSRQQHIRDWYVAVSNRNYIQYWSIFQCTVIILVGSLQVYFLRKMFDSQNVISGSSKPRA